MPLIASVTERLPLVVADPQEAGQNGVLYPPADIANPTASNGLPGAGLPNLRVTHNRPLTRKSQIAPR